MTKLIDIRTRVSQLLPGATEEALRRCLPFLLGGFPATPKITSPEPDGPIFDFAGLGWVVACRTNRIDIDHLLTVYDLTNGTTASPDQVITPADYLFFTLIPPADLVAGNEYRIRMDVAPGAKPATHGPHEYDTVYLLMT